MSQATGHTTIARAARHACPALAAAEKLRDAEDAFDAVCGKSPQPCRWRDW